MIRSAVCSTAIVACVSAEYSNADNVKLISLLHDVDSSDHVSRLLTEVPVDSLGSFLEKKNWKKKSRRFFSTDKKDHDNDDDNEPAELCPTACECASEDVSGRLDCMERRSGLLSSISDDFQKKEILLGLSRIRSEYQELLSDTDDMNGETATLVAAVTNQTSGYEVQAKADATKILNSEYNIAKVFNSNWMNLLNASDVSVGAIGDIAQLRNDAIGNVTVSMNDAQTLEEGVNFANFQKVVQLAQKRLGETAKNITDSEKVVWGNLTGLSNTMGGTDSDAWVLADALSQAVATLSGAIPEFQSSIDKSVTDFNNTVEGDIEGLRADYAKSGSVVLAAARGQAMSKIDIATETGKANAVAQEASIWSALKKQEAAVDNNIYVTNRDHRKLVKVASQSLGNVSSTVVQQLKNATTQVGVDVNSHRGSLNTIDSDVERIQGVLNTIHTAETQTGAASNSQLTNELQQANTHMTGLLGALGMGSMDGLTTSEQVADGAVSALGSQTQGSLAQMSSQFRDLQQFYAQQAAKVAADDQTATGNIELAVDNAGAAIDKVGPPMKREMNAVGQQILDKLIGVPIELPEGVAAPFDGAIGMDDAATRFNTAGNDTVVEVDGQIANTLNAVDGTVTIVEGAAEASAKTEDELNLDLSNGTISKTATFQSGTETENYASSSLENAGNSVEGAENALIEMITEGAQVTVAPSTAETPTVVVPSGTLDSLEKTQEELDENGKKTSEAVEDATKENEETREKLDSEGKTVESIGTQTEQLVNNAVLGGKSDVEGAAGSANSGGALTVRGWLEKLTQLNSSTDATLAQAGLGQLQTVRDMAASVDATMSQISSYVQTNSGDLFDDVQGVPNKVHRLQSVLDHVQALANTAIPAVVWDQVIRDMMGRMSWLKDAASGALNEIDTAFATNSSQTVTDTLDKVRDIVSSYGTSADAIKAQLDMVEAEATKAEAESEAADSEVLGGLASVVSKVGSLQTTGNTELSKASTLPTVGATVFQGASVVAGGASGVAELASDRAGDMAQQAALQAQVAGDAVKSLQSASAQKLEQQAIDASAKQAAAFAVLKQREAAMEALRNETTSSISDFTSEAKQLAAVQFNKANYVYDQVTQAQADTSTLIGKVMSTLASRQSNVSEAVDTQHAKTEAQLALIRQRISNLNTLFNTYVRSSKRLFGQALADKDSFGDALKMEAKTKLNSLDAMLFTTANKLTNDRATLSADAASITNASDDFDNNYNNLDEAVDAWTTNERKNVQNVASSLDTIQNAVDPITATSVTASLGVVVKTVANAASKLISSFGYTVPALIADAVTDPDTPIASEYAKLTTTTPAVPAG